MGIFSTIAGLVFGDNPIKTITEGLVKAHSDAINGKTESERTEANRQINLYNAALGDLQKARAAASGFPKPLLWMMILAGSMFCLHPFLIGLGTNFQPLILGTWLGDWLLHVPPFPEPFDKNEAQVLSYFFGGGAVVGLGVMAIKTLRK